MKTDSGKLSVTKKLVKIVHPFWEEETVTLINYQTIKKMFL